MSSRRFLPKLARQTLDQTLERCGVLSAPDNMGDIEKLTSCTVENGVLRIGNTVCDITPTDKLMKVPDTLFYDNSLVSVYNKCTCKSIHFTLEKFFLIYYLVAV